MSLYDYDVDDYGREDRDDYYNGRDRDSAILDEYTEEEVRANFEEVLERVNHGESLSAILNYGIGKDDLKNLAILYRDREDLQEKIYDLMEDCNFHSELRDFENGNFEKYIEDEKPLTPRERANKYIEQYGNNALEQFKADSVDYKKMTPEEKQTYGIINATLKSKEFNDRLVQGVDAVFNNDKFKEWLAFSRNFHNYSFNNVMNIFIQCPNATMVASKTDWAKMGRRINDEDFGKGITISVPNFRDFTDKEKLEKFLEKQVADGWMSENEAEKYRVELDEKGKVGILSGFSYGKVYDVSMTNGKELPKNEARETLNLSLDNFEDIKATLMAISEENNVSIEYASADDGKLSNAYGYFSPMENRIVVRDVDYEGEPRSQADVIRTTSHEMAHSMLHGNEMLTAGVESSDKAFSRSEKEIEAEGTALLVCEHIGFDSGANTYGYLASYLPEESEKRIEILKKATDKILKCSAEINARFDEKYAEIVQSKEADRDMVEITCYGDTRTMERNEAVKFYMDAMNSCDPNSSECSRYITILQGLQAGDKVVSDEKEMVSFGKSDVKPEKNKTVNKGETKG